ncbi:DNA polymerase delta subunit 3-like [Limulus polyphemus]|uniref:DNA polymerase delta subunit 3 n=1 Tax=Limulus polyphemus TaxID=6850 RepID=A0ABM1B660_LIMPO|nr:DNA polymerase delta subunit 3-like [Limulus polyphemus]
MATESEILSKIEELVYDEGRIVSYKTLSRILSIHVNTAKHSLAIFLKKVNSEKVYACYLLAGSQNLGSGDEIHKIAIVPEDRLEKAKKTFACLTSIHIYSVQKTNLKDSSPLFTTDVCDNFKDGELDQRLCGIRPFKPLENQSWAERVVQLSPSSSQNDRNASSAKPKSVGESNSLDIESETENNERKNEKLEKKATEEKFREKEVNIREQNKKQEKKKLQSKSTPQLKQKQANVMSLFSKQTQKSKNSSPINSNSQDKMESSSDSVVPVQEINIGKEHEMSIVSKPNKNSHMINKQKEPPKSNIRKKTSRTANESDEELQPQVKKHRRIVQMLDSDSESSDEESESEEIIPPTPFEPEDNVENKEEKDNVSSDSEEPIPPTPTDNKRKHVKVVTRTFAGDDGFMVTKKDKEYVSDPEDQEEKRLSPKTNQGKKPIKKTSDENSKNLTGPKKQVSLMNFFGKK